MSDFAPPVVGLGYIRVESALIDRWNAFGADVLGAQPSLEGEHLWLRLDDRPYRIVVEPGEREHLHSTGWEVRDEATLERIEAELGRSIGGRKVHGPGRARLTTAVRIVVEAKLTGADDDLTGRGPGGLRIVLQPRPGPALSSIVVVE